MRDPARRIGGILAALVSLGGAAAGTKALSTAYAQARHEELAEAAEGVRVRADDTVKAQLANLEGRAVSASSNPVLRAQLGVVDAATLRDGFSTEPWWEPVRRDFPIYGVAAGTVPEVLVGAEGSGLDFTALIDSARKHQQASSVLAAADTVVIAGAAVAQGSSKGAPFVVVLAKPIDARFLDEVVSRTRGAAILSDGRQLLLSSGPRDQQQRLKAVVAKEGLPLWEGGDWVAAASRLAPHLWLWTYALPRSGGQKAPIELIALWVLAGGAAVLAVAVAFRRPSMPRLPAPRPLVKTEVGRTEPEYAAPTDPGGRPIRSDPHPTSPGTNRTRVRGQPSDPGAGSGEPGPVMRPNHFGRYYLVDRLGEGGMAEVYTAVAFGAENFRRAFVVKLLHSSAQRTVGLVEMFIDEAKLASTLIHSNIIPVYDFGKLGDEYYMAQEYVLGRDLRKLVTVTVGADGKPLSPPLAVHIAREALRALEYAHTRTTDDGRPMGIVHRDVSPNNILVSARGEVKLFDFGIAKAEEGRLHQTQAGVVKGNVQYMSPEQARGEKVDARGDVYSLGLVLYFLLSGRSLYRGENAFALLLQAAQGLTPDLLPLLEKLPAQHAAVLRVALEPDREQRFQSAAAFENALAQLPGGSAGELDGTMQRLFGEELRAEQAKFVTIEPPPEEPPSEDGEEVR